MPHELAMGWGRAHLAPGPIPVCLGGCYWLRVEIAAFQ